MIRFPPAIALAAFAVLSACGGDATPPADPPRDAGHRDGGPADTDADADADAAIVTLTAEQIALAGIELARPTNDGAATIDLPAIVEGDPQATQVVSAAIGGRVVALHRNLGETVARGQAIAVIESREAARIKGDVQAATARLALADANLARERRLFAQSVSPEQDLIAARTAATEARIALTQARSMMAATGVAGGGGGSGGGGGGGNLNRIGIVAPIAGRVIARPVVLGQTVAADAELYRVADLARVALAISLKPEDAGRIRPGNAVTVTAPGRRADARIRFVSPALDPETRLVPAIAMLDNRGGQWRVGEPVTASIRLTGDEGTGAIRVPTTAVQTVDNRSVVFVRTATGFRATPVALGTASGDAVIVRRGLTGREQVATTGSFTLKAELGKGAATHADH